MFGDPLSRARSTQNPTHYSERTATGPPLASLLPSRRRNFGSKIAFLLLDAFAQPEANETGDLDGAADFSFGFLERLRHALFVVVNVDLLQQRHFLVESLQARFDNLFDHVGR